MEGEAVVSAEVQSGVQAGDERAVAQALRANREAKIEAAKPKPEKKEIQKPEAKTEPKGQPEQKVEKAEPERQPASSKEEPKSEVPAPEKPEAVAGAEKPAETKPEEPKEPPRFKVAIEGKEEEVTVDELRSGYMRQRDYTLKTQELAKERETFSSETTQRKQVVENTINELGVLAQHMVQRLVDEDQTTNWQQLQQTDPEAYAARMTRRLENREMLRTVLAKATQMQSQQKKEQEEKFKSEFLNRRKSEEAKLALVIPEWSDPEKAKAEKAELGKFLTERGFSKDELMSFIDHRAIALSREAMLYRRIQEAKKKAEGEKKVEAKAPASPAAPAADGSGSASRLERLQSKFKNSGGSDLTLAAKLLAERRKQARR